MPSSSGVLAALATCAPGDSPERLLAPDKLAGPAAASVQGGRVSRDWSVDGGAIKVDSAPVEEPALTERQAACNLLAGFTPNGALLADIAPTGSVLGYGRLTISSKLPHTSLDIGQGQGHPTPPIYQNRPAWILTVSFSPTYSCPMMTVAPAPTRSAPHSWSYVVVAIDAMTGRDAITYVEAAPGGCWNGRMNPAASTVPTERISLLWRGLSVSAGGATGTVEVSATRCDKLPQNAAWVSQRQPQLEVAAFRLLGQPCANAAWRTIPLHPATVSQAIPKRLTHAASGPIDRVGG